MDRLLDLRSVARALSGDIAGRDTVVCPGPGHSRRDRSLAVRLDSKAPDGFLTYSHAGDDWRLCRDHVRERLGLPDWQSGDEQRRSIPSHHLPKWDFAMIEDDAADARRTEDDLLRIKRAAELWNAADDPRGTLAEKYLASRCLELDGDIAGRVLRFHPRCPWRNEATGKTVFVPAMLGAFRSIDDDEITAVHRIALNPDGTKLGRRMLGTVQRAAVKIDPAPVDGVLAIAEGIETAMAARQLDVRPVWALGSAGAISFFPLIPGVRELQVCAENDAANEAAMKLCAKRWRKEQRRVRSIRPPDGFNDINDCLMGARNAKAS